MPVITVQANGITTPDDWSLGAGASKWAAVNRPDDDATSYVQSPGTSGNYQYFTFAPALSAGDTITQIVVQARNRRVVSDCTFRMGYQFTPQGGGTQTSESAAGALTAGNLWDNHTFTHSGLSVLWGSNLVAWIRNTQARAIQLTSFDIEITYTAASTGGSAGALVNGTPLKSRLRGLV